MSVPGYQKVVQVRVAGTTVAFEVMPATSASLNLAGDVLDDTDLTSTGMRSRILGLRDWSVSAPINFGSSVTAFATLRSAWLNRTKLEIQYLPDGTVGYSGNVWVETFSHSGDVGGLESVDVSLQAAGALSTV